MNGDWVFPQALRPRHPWSHQRGGIKRRFLKAPAVLVVFLVSSSYLCTPSSAADSSAECFLIRTNEARAQARRASLAIRDDLTRIASDNAKRLAESGSLFHDQDLASKAPSGWRVIGENVGYGPDCQTIHKAFMDSQSHRANILDRDYEAVGAGVAYSRDAAVYVSVVFAGFRSTSRSSGLNEAAPSSAPSRETSAADESFREQGIETSRLRLAEAETMDQIRAVPSSKLHQQRRASRLEPLFLAFPAVLLLIAGRVLLRNRRVELFGSTERSSR